MTRTREYVVEADGWVAGRWRARGSLLMLSDPQAKYENVTLKPEAAPKTGGTGKRRRARPPADETSAAEAGAQ